MSLQAATILTLPMAFEMVKMMQADGLQWDDPSDRFFATRAVAG